MQASKTVYIIYMYFTAVYKCTSVSKPPYKGCFTLYAHTYIFKLYKINLGYPYVIIGIM